MGAISVRVKRAKKVAKKRNPQDSTNRNVRAGHKRYDDLKQRLIRIERLVRGLKRFSHGHGKPER